MRTGAQKAGRDAPPLIAHAPVCVHDDVAQVRAAVRDQLGGYPSNTFYTQMFVDAGFPEVAETKAWSDEMIEAVALTGSEARVRSRIRELFSYGASEIIVSVVTAGRDPAASYQRTLRLLAEVSA